MVIMNFTHVYDDHDFMHASTSRWIDCTAIEGAVRYCDDEGQAELVHLMQPHPVNSLHWIDSGDYHYLTKLWTDRLAEPFALVVYDHHPDMQEPAFGDILSCGGWVRRALQENPWLRHVTLIGIADGLLEETDGFGDRLTVIAESQVAAQDALWAPVPHGLPVYISLDKDVLRPAEVLTNWDQGSMTFDQLQQSLQHYQTTCRVLGVDVCGEEPRVLTDAALAACKAQNEIFNASLYAILKPNE